MNKITNTGIKSFLNDVVKNSEITLLEEGAKELSELESIAEARGIKIKDSRDLAIFKTVYAFCDKANDNGAILPKKEMLKKLPGIIGKPININHDRSKVVGFYFDYKFIEKSSTIIAYGIFFKSYFGHEWEAAQNLFKNKKLSSSFEIWSPSNKRKELSNGDYELWDVEIGGGALIYEDSENTPAFPGAKVLALAKKETERKELVYASKHKPEEIITADITQTIPTINVITCSNCSEKFEIGGLDSNIKCPKCFAILNHEGQMLYPPQIKDFSLLCPACKVNNWLILSNTENKSKVRCMSCAKEYDITFKTKTTAEALDNITFLYSGYARCYQCNHSIVFEGLSKVKTREFKCPKCGLVFTHNIDKAEKYRTVASIQEIEVKIKDNEIVKSSQEGGKEMEPEKKPEIVVEKVEEVVEKVITTEEKVEEVIPTVKPADESSLKEAPKAEVKVEEVTPIEPKEEVKVEVTPKEKEEINADIEFEKTFEKEAEYDITISKIVNFVKVAHSLEIAKEHKTLSKEERKSLSDSYFAVVITTTNRKTGKERKIRMFPIVDEAHVKYALKQLATKEMRENLTKLGANLNDIRRKVIKRARKLNLTKLAESLKEEKAKVEKIKAGVNKTVKQLIEANKQVELYKTNAKEIISRRSELDKFDTDLTDEDILIDEKYEKAKLQKENALLKASETKEDEIVSSIKKDNDYYSKKRSEINKLAFPENK